MTVPFLFFHIFNKVIGAMKQEEMFQEEIYLKKKKCAIILIIPNNQSKWGKKPAFIEIAKKECQKNPKTKQKKKNKKQKQNKRINK